MLDSLLGLALPIEWVSTFHGNFFGAAAAVCSAVLVLMCGRAMSGRIQYLGANEQLLLKELTGKRVVNGPAVFFPSPLTTLSYKKRTGLSLTQLQYVRVKNTATGEIRTEKGPAVLLLGPYDEAIGATQEAKVLSDTQSLTVSDQSTGARRLIVGPTTFIPAPLESIIRVGEAISLRQSQYVVIENALDGSARVERGEQMLFLGPNESAGAVQEGFRLNAHQQVRLRCSLSGGIRVERGVKLVFPSAHEKPIDDPPVQDAIDLKAWEYTTIQDRDTGKVRIVRGEALVFLGATERIMSSKRKESAIVVDKEHAVLVRNRDTGAQRLIQEPQRFVPSPEDEVVEVRELLRLSDNEAIILKNEQGVYDIRFGDPSKGTPRAFFLPPHWEVVTLMWSRGRRREKRDLPITIFDTRPQYMSFEFNCRTSDNVEMTLEGTVFWEVVSISDLLSYTSDAPGDMCSHARSCFIQLISKVTLQEFMATFNAIAKTAHSSDDEFYTRRGIKIHSLEVTRYACADRSTAVILEQIISETTNRMNRLSCQESENEVGLAKLKGQEEIELARSKVLEIQQKHDIESARAEGLAEAERVLSFLNHIQKSSTSSGSDDETSIVQSPKLAQDLWHALRRAEGLQAVAQGNAHVYFTPDQANISIETRPSPAAANL